MWTAMPPRQAQVSHPRIMHPPRPNGATERPKTADRLTDWLLTHCPLSSLTLLTMLVVSSAFGFAGSWPILAAATLGDLGITAVRWRRRAKRPAHSGGVRPNAPA